jgi:serine protease AprX
MLIARCCHQRRQPLAFRRRLAPALSTISAVLTAAALVCPVAAEQGAPVPRHDRRVLSEIAQDVLRRAASGPDQPVARVSLPTRQPDEGVAAAGSAADLGPPATDIAPVQAGTIVKIAPGTPAPGRKTAPTTSAAGYQSNSWRQRSDTARGLSFASGVRAAASGLDPALAAHADGLRAEGHEFAYGFVLLRAPLDEKLEKKLAGLGLAFLGPHDDHHKARLPVDALEAIAGLPEVEWVGVSEPEQKLSSELTEVLSARTPAAAIDAATPIPLVINLFEGDEAGSFRRQLEAAGAAVGEYDADLHFYRAVATAPVLEKIAALDFVQFVELIRLTAAAHDQSTALVDADMIRRGTSSYGITRFDATYIPLGLLDSGYYDNHEDLAHKTRCWNNITTEPTEPFTDPNGHGTHVAGTIAGTGDGDRRYRGVAPGLADGAGADGTVKIAKIWDRDLVGSAMWMELGMNWLALQNLCGMPTPLLVNLSGGFPGKNQRGTDSTSRKLDYTVWNDHQLYVVAAGNGGSDDQTIASPGVAKNALTVGAVLDYGDVTVGDIATKSSRGPTGDGRMKPNVVAPGYSVTSTQAGTVNGYTTKGGTSMATAHVTGLAATLMDHYPEFRLNPALMRAHLMATAIGHDGATGKTNDYGLGRVSGYLAHWAHTNSDGWSTYWSSGYVNSSGYQYRDITVPPNTRRLVVVMTWDEAPASAGASRAVLYDLDLWISYNGDCGDPRGLCGAYASTSSLDNVEYVVVNNPPAGTYRLKVAPYSASTSWLAYGLAAMVIRGDPAPGMTGYVTAPATALLYSTFPVTVSVTTPSYVASGVRMEIASHSPWAEPSFVRTTQYDGIGTKLEAVLGLTLGNVFPSISRSATFEFVAKATGLQTVVIRASSENASELVLSAVVNVVTDPTNSPDLVETALTTNPPAPIVAPGSTFSATDTVQNAGTREAAPSTTRYYLSLDAVKSSGDTLLTGTHQVPGLDPGRSHTATVTVTVPPNVAQASYFILACADDQNAVANESNEGNNCIASAGAIVTVAKADLVEAGATMNPPAPIKAPGSTFSVNDTVRNQGLVASAPSTTRYYLSLDPIKGVGDILLLGSRAIPALSAGAVHSGTVTLTVPPTTPLATYFFLTCADDVTKVAESDEANNCLASPAAAVTVTRPDLVETAVSSPPATKQRGTPFPITDTVQNAGAVPSAGSVTRYYLSLDAVKSAGDLMLTGGRTVPGLAPGGSHSGTVTMTIPSNTPLNTYFVLACADGPSALVETDETNNCKASSTTVTVTP